MMVAPISGQGICNRAPYRDEISSIGVEHRFHGGLPNPVPARQCETAASRARPAPSADGPSFPLDGKTTGKIVDRPSETAIYPRKPRAKSSSCEPIPVAGLNGNLNAPNRELNTPNREINGKYPSTHGDRARRTARRELEQATSLGLSKCDKTSIQLTLPTLSPEFVFCMGCLFTIGARLVASASANAVGLCIGIRDDLTGADARRRGPISAAKSRARSSCSP
jgi:hypothetical protein